MLSDVLTIILTIITILYVIKSNRNTIKKLSLKQKFGVCVTFIATIAFATMSMYFGGSWLVSFLEEGILKTLITYAIIIVVLMASLAMMHKIVHKITDGLI